MNFEKPSTLEQQEPVSNYPPPDHPRPPPTKHRWWLWLLILVVVGLVVYHFRARSSQSQAASATSRIGQGREGRRLGAIPVVAVAAHKGDIGVYFTGLGAVTPIYTVTVKSQISGYLMKVLYKEGDTVHQGDLLAEIDPRPYQVMLEQAEAGLARDQANLRTRKVDLARYQTLAPLKAIPEQQLATQAALVKQDEATSRPIRRKSTAPSSISFTAISRSDNRPGGFAPGRSRELCNGQRRDRVGGDHPD